MITISKRNKMSYAILIISILVLMFSVVAVTYAIYRNSASLDNQIAFDKIYITPDSKFNATTSTSVYAGAKITGGEIAFSKPIDSRSVYVRAKITFSLAGGGTDEQKEMTQKYLDDLNKINLPIVTTVQNGAVWNKSGEYYYLVESSNSGSLKLVNDTTRYLFCNQIVIPDDFKQYTGDSNLVLDIKMGLSIEAVQAEGNESKTFDQMKQVFDATF